jgi:phosphoribosylamine--glycine ligase
MVESVFQQAGKKIVIEEYLEGIEASIICVVDNNTIVPLITAQDHKTIFENNQGPNTGGMGVIAPNQHVSAEIMEDFSNNIMQKTFLGLKRERFNFHGFLFFGVMITKKGCKLLEYNVRMGDPECQSILPLMDFDLVEMFMHSLQNKLNKFTFNWKQGVAVNVVLASRGYPGSYTVGSIIAVKQNPLIFYSGVKMVNKHLCTNGGRVLSVVGIGDTPVTARKEVYKHVALVDFKGKYFRKDIGSH